IDFQVNRGVVALNDLSNGTLWMVDKDMFIIHPEDWRNIVPEDKKEDDNQESTETNVVPERSEENRPPVANDDPNLSARAGTSTILHVLDNDTDPDGDVLTIIASEDQTGMSLQPINNGAGLQISLEGAATGTYEIKYTIDDGRKGTDTAVATVKVLPADRSVNKAPTPVDRPGG
ncbi:MAG: cadherin-like domain-containing protein, partial [Microthrixaceae bacterium]|nr:cadherin-like domain-containing protein [Microthrixaceae bacterium]